MKVYSVQPIQMHGRAQPKIAGGGGQSEVQKGTLLLMMIWHKKRAPARKKSTFSPRLPGGGGLPIPRCLGTALKCQGPTAYAVW